MNQCKLTAHNRPGHTRMNTDDNSLIYTVLLGIDIRPCRKICMSCGLYKSESLSETISLDCSDADAKYVSESMSDDVFEAISHCSVFMLEYRDLENIPHTLEFLNEYQLAFISAFLSRFR